MTPILSLPTSHTELQWFYTRDELLSSPSIREGISVAEEWKQRARAVRRLWKLRDALQVRQSVVSTAATFIHRFFMRESMNKWHYDDVAVAAFFLACKSEEEPRPIKAIVSSVLTRSGQHEAASNSQSPSFIDYRKKLVATEEAVLRALCYDLTVRQPHWLAVKAATQMWTGAQAEVGTKVAKVAWNFLTDTLPQPLCLLYRPEVLAAASLLFACAHLDIPFPSEAPSLADQKSLHDLAIQEAEEGEEPPAYEPVHGWKELLGFEESELADAAREMMRGYKLAEDDFVAAEAAQLFPKVEQALAVLVESPSPSANGERMEVDSPPS
ncbi:cyclin Pch1 [Rhodotorula toruloides]|uniref:Cyclin Pch1 n=1 Tax=Rhodotorula toruloides TaxID=5286 RepID=A0A511KMW3_RHOTO|nr:cyclin Pch1 [Rhodotorula toruloides]